MDERDRNFSPDELAHMQAGARLLRSFREEAGLSENALAEILDQTESWIKDFDKGRIQIPKDPEFYRKVRKMGISDFCMKLFLNNTGASVETLIDVLPPRSVLRIEDGTIIPLYASEYASEEMGDEEFDGLKQFMRNCYYDFKYGRRMDGMPEWIDEFGIQAH